MPKQYTSVPTIKELATVLGLSHSTVSRALNDHPAISALTKSRVSDEADRAGYIANNAARMLKQESSRVLGLVIPDIKNSFYTSIAQILAESAVSHGWQMILATTDDDPEREMRAVKSLLETRAEGVIISPTAMPLPNTITMLNRLNSVQLLRTVKSLSKVPCVVVDDAFGIGLATSHLLTQGNLRVAYIGTLTTLSTGRNRFRGYEKALKAGGVQLDRALCVFGAPRAYFGATAFLELMDLPLPPTAIVIGGPEIAEGVLVEAAQKNVLSSAGLSLVSYGEMSWHKVIHGGITSVRLPEQEIARASFDLLLAAKAGRQLSKICIKPYLVERGSSPQLPDR